MQLSSQILSRAREIAVSGETSNVNQIALMAIDELAAARGVGLEGSETTLIENIESKLAGFGVLQEFLDDPAVEEIWVNRPNEVFIARNSETECIEVDLPTDEIKTLTFRMLRNSGRRIDRLMPFVDATLSDGSRLHAAIPDVTATHWSINIRKFRKKFKHLSSLVASHMLSETEANFLSMQVKAGKSFLISGATQAGKTTFLNALLNELDESTRLITCEESFEISCELRDWVALQARQPNLEGQGEIALRRLVKESLRMRPERLVIGEVREAEAFDLLIAMNSGVPGMSTIHSNSASAAISKLCALPLLAGPNITSEFILNTVSNSLDFVIQLGRRNGLRVVSEIARVTSGTSGEPKVESVLL